MGYARLFGALGASALCYTCPVLEMDRFIPVPVQLEKYTKENSV